MMVRTPKAVAAHLVDLSLVEICWDNSSLCDVHIFSREGLVLDCSSDLRGSSRGSEVALQIRQDGQSKGMEMDSPERPEFQIHTFTDTSFSTSGGRSRSGSLICLVVPGTGEHSVLQWSSRRQTITAYSAPKAEIVAMSEGIMTSLLTYDAAEFLGVSEGVSPQLKIRLRTDSDTSLRQLKNDLSLWFETDLSGNAIVIFAMCAMEHSCMRHASICL